MSIIRIDDSSVRLCCSGKKNCPTMTDLGDGMVEITDDYGNKITVKKEEALLLSDGAKTLLGEKQLILG